MDDELYPQAVAGWRAFKTNNQGHLYSLFQFSAGSRYCWNKGVNKAACTKDHSSPNESCACGLYAYYHSSQLRRIGISHFFKEREIEALVAASGKAELHHHGFRASQMQIIAIIKPWPFSHKAQQAADLYKVPLVTKKEAEEMIEDNNFVTFCREDLPELNKKAKTAYRIDSLAAILAEFLFVSWIATISSFLISFGSPWNKVLSISTLVLFFSVVFLAAISSKIDKVS